MADSQYKTRQLQGLDPVYPAIGGLAPRTPARWSPSGAVMRAQDTVPASSRRIIGRWSLSGAQDWAQPRGTDDPGSDASPVGAQVYPDNTWRSLGTFHAHVTPGCEIVAYVVRCPSGIVQLGPFNFTTNGIWGQARLGVTWTNGASSTGPHYRTASIEGTQAGTYGGQEALGAGQNWSQTKITSLGRHRPPTFLTTPADAVTYSEWSDVEIELGIRGGVRIVEFVIYEQPIAHTTVNTDDGLTSVHAMPATLAPLTPGPLTKAPDGATYEEHRFGTRRTAQVAERQSERLGPRIMQWTCYDESDTSIWAQAEGNPATRSGTFVHLLDSTLGTGGYNLHSPGWVVGSAYAQLARLCDPTLIARGSFAAVPVRVRVDAEQSAGTGTVRVQCGPYDWVDVTVTGARATWERSGIIEGQVFADHAAYPLVVWIRGTGGTLSVYSVSVDFGTW
ncbi:MAG: hypothetical protein ACRCZP_20010 [Phycicoccus sp.]